MSKFLELVNTHKILFEDFCKEWDIWDMPEALTDDEFLRLLNLNDIKVSFAGHEGESEFFLVMKVEEQNSVKYYEVEGTWSSYDGYDFCGADYSLIEVEPYEVTVTKFRSIERSSVNE